jgi:predicted metal-dependent peptidase
VSDLIRLRKRQLEELDLLVKQGGSAPASGDGEPGGQGTSTAQDGSEATDGKGGIVTAGNCGKAEDHQWGAGDDPEDAQAAAREIVNAAVSMMNEEIRGLMPAGFMSQVQRINAPPVISWQALLKKYVGTISAEKRRTRTRLNRRQPDRFDLSGAIDEKILKIVVAVDTSGSMDDAQIQAVFREIFAILAKRKYEVTIIECDAKVQRVYKVSKPANIALSVKGRGGTAFTPVVEYINNDRYFRDALLIYFTDGYGENAIPRPRTYRNLWVILGNTAHLSLREPYGTKVAMQQAQRR